MKTTQLILAAFFATAVFSQSALAFGAIWKYGGNYGFGRGVGAVADYKTQAEADRTAIAQCKKERPAYAARSKWGKCRIVEQFSDECVAYSRFIIKGTRRVPNAGDSNATAPTVTEDHSSMLFYENVLRGAKLNEMTFPAQFFTNNPEKQIIKDMLRLHPFVTCRNSKWKNSDYGTNVNPKYRADPNFVSFDMDCNKPTHHGGVCDNVGYALEATEGDGR